jgi:hypothetical protein
MDQFGRLYWIVGESKIYALLYVLSVWDNLVHFAVSNLVLGESEIQ